MLPIKRALISVSDKTQIIPFAQMLQRHACEIFSTGGTLKVLNKQRIPATDISVITKNPEAFGGRVKTLSFHVSAALLFNREKDAQEAKKLGVEPIDLVVCNLYPFRQVKEDHTDFSTLVEHIDIGGTTMIRSAAKNFEGVAVVTNPKDYHSLGEEIDANNGCLSLQTRKKLMRQAFHYTADYDAFIATTMDAEENVHSMRMSFSEGHSLRYGENSHQSAVFFRDTAASDSLYDMDLLHGKQLSYNNLVDINSAVEAVQELSRSGCAVIKHNVPCGLCESDTPHRSLELAWQSDPISAFGSVIAFNCEVTCDTVHFLQLCNPDKSQRKFIEVLIAPRFSTDALEMLRIRKNLRIIEYDTTKMKPRFDYTFLRGSLLKQDSNTMLASEFNVVTKRAIPSIQQNIMEFGLKAVRHVKSNAIVVVRTIEDGSFQLLGMGTGQPNRLTAVSLAIEKCRENLSNEYNGPQDGEEVYIRQELERSTLISEAFFPFPDSIELCAEYGIKTILQPGGSIRDSDVIQRCDDLDISMVFTGLRHFKH